MVTTQQKTLVQESWNLVQPIADQAAALFYGKLFELDPSLRPLFKGDMQQQGAKLMKTLGMAVASLNDFARLEPVVQALGQRHVDYGVKSAHYPIVAEALLWTLEQGLGDAAAPSVLEAWAAVYGALSSIMITASEAKGSLSTAAIGGGGVRSGFERSLSLRPTRPRAARFRAGSPARRANTVCDHSAARGRWWPAPTRPAPGPTARTCPRPPRVAVRLSCHQKVGA